MKPAESRHILFVLGMHRSGTSALCAALQACGASFGGSLLEPMDGVNDEGFWEDADVVRLNEQLLEHSGLRWFTATAEVLEQDWQGEPLREFANEAKRILQRGFGEAALEVAKDPRLCLTLPLWLAAAGELGVETSACVISRAPLEVARSLEKRDGFPLGYGLRLLQTYRRGIAKFAPPGSPHVNYQQLLDDPAAAMRQWAGHLPLQVDAAAMAAAVRVELRHQGGAGASATSPSLEDPDLAGADLDSIDAAIAAAFPPEQTLAEFAAGLVERGEQLSQIGSAHATALATLDARDADIAALSAQHKQALATLDERDADIAGLSAEHRQALAVIAERDEQIREFDRRLAKIGEEHTHALAVIRERDEQVALLQERLEYIYNLPGVRLAMRLLRKNARG